MDTKASMNDSDRMSYRSTTTTDDLPPPYDDLSRPPSSVFTDISSATLTGPTAPTPNRPFPAAFNLYYPYHGKLISRTQKLLIGEHFDQPCNAVVLKGSMAGLEITLHEGPETDTAVVATSCRRPGSTSFIITLPGSLSVYGTPIESHMEQHVGFKHVSHSFSVEITSAADPKPHLEKFEWRLSHGKEVKVLDKWAWGWKLVRLEGNPSSQPEASSSSSSTKREDRDLGFTSDGKEVVAVWAPNSHWSKNKLGKFRFLGSGLTGELGEAWARMAVATVLSLWQGTAMK